MKTLALFLLLIALVGCTPVEPERYYVCSDGSQVKNPNSCPSVVPKVDVEQPVITEPDPVESRELPADVKDLLTKADKVKIVRFNYFDSNNPYQENIYVSSRNRTKVLLATKVSFTEFDKFDTVYLDLNTKRGVAYCEDKSDELCPNKNSPTSVNYTKYSTMSPLDWLSMIEYGELTNRSKVIQGRTGKELDFTSKGKQGKLYLDSFFGIPIQATFDGLTYEYTNLVINQDKETTLVHQRIED